jgi:Mor family transcriptional regulator
VVKADGTYTAWILLQNGSMAYRNAGIVAAFKKGISGTDLAKKFEISISQTYRIINEAGEKKTKKVRR